MTTRRIDLSLLDDDLRTLINSSAKIFPVPYSYIQNGGNPYNHEYVRVNDSVHKNEVYVWDVNKFVLIGADDFETLWAQIKEKPNTFPPDLHTHNDMYYTKLEVNGISNGKVDVVEGKDLSTNDFTDAIKSNFEDALVDLQYVTEKQLTHESDSAIHVTQADKAEIAKVSTMALKSYVDTQDATKVNSTTFTGHTGNSSIHVTQTDKDTWNAKEPAITKLTAFNKNYGTSAGTVSEGNHGHDATYVKYNEAIMNTNPFGGKKLYINSLNNALFIADKRYVVTGIRYSSVDNSVLGVLNPSELSSIFDGNYESYLSIPANQYVVINITFNGGTFPGYPYGDIYLSHYHTYYSESAKLRTYTTYEPHVVGWHEYPFTDFVRGASSLILTSRNPVYSITQMEFVIYAPLTTNACISQVDFKLDRPGTNEMPTIDKFKSNKLYFPLDMGSNKLLNVSTPTATNDGANKSYVDTQDVKNKINLGSVQPPDGWWYKEV